MKKLVVLFYMKIVQFYKFVVINNTFKILCDLLRNKTGCLIFNNYKFVADALRKICF